MPRLNKTTKGDFVSWLFVALTIAGCTSNQAATTVTTPPSLVSARIPAPGITQVDSTSEPPEEDVPTESAPALDPSSASGVAVTLPVPDSERNLGRYREAILAGGSTFRGSVEATNFLAECLADHGFNARVVEAGAMEVAVGDQREAYDSAVSACDAQAVDTGVYAFGDSDIPDPETLRVWYRAYVEVAMPCLEAAGEEVPSPPTVDVWVENYPDVWHPHGTGGSRLGCTEDIVELLVELGLADDAASGSP